MKQLKLPFAICLLAAPLLFGARAAAQSSPREVASRFYTLVVREDPSGLPDARQMRLLGPYLSRDLRALFGRAQTEQAAFVRANPDEKPPNVEGCLFSCLFEGPKRFGVGQPRMEGRFAHVEVRQSGEPRGDFKWADTLVLVKEGGRWVVWDIRMGCDWPFRIGPTLRAMLGEESAGAASQTGGPRVEYLTGERARALPFSDAVRVGHMLYLSGQIGTDSSFKLVPGGVKAETKQTMENIRRILERHGSSLGEVVKCTVMLADMSEWGAVNEVYVTYFDKNRLPARSALGASGLALGARVEVECWATVK